MDAWGKPKFALNAGIRPEDLAQAQAKAQNTNHVPLQPKVVYRYMFSRSTIANFIKIAKKTMIVITLAQRFKTITIFICIQSTKMITSMLKSHPIQIKYLRPLVFFFV